MKSQASERRIVFLHRQMPPLQGQTPIDLVLTPQFYTMKRDDLPIRFAFQARKLAPSLLEEAGDPQRLRYEVLKEGEGWLYFAYDPEEVASFLRNKGIAPERVSRLYFAQQFAPLLKQPVLLSGGTQALSLVDGTVTILPSSLLQERPGRFAESLPLPDQSFRFPQGKPSSRLGSKQALWLLVGATILGAAWMIEGIRHAKSASELEARLEKALQEHPALQSRLARTNILEKYRSIDRLQRQIRDRIHAVGTLVSKETKLNRLKVDAQGYQASIDAPSSKLPTLKQMAREADLKLSQKPGAGGLELKGTWR